MLLVMNLPLSASGWCFISINCSGEHTNSFRQRQKLAFSGLDVLGCCDL